MAAHSKAAQVDLIGRRIAGFRRLLDQLRALPGHASDPWARGQIRYAERMLEELTRAAEVPTDGTLSGDCD